MMTRKDNLGVFLANVKFNSAWFTSQDIMSLIGKAANGLG